MIPFDLRYEGRRAFSGERSDVPARHDLEYLVLDVTRLEVPDAGRGIADTDVRRSSGRIVDSDDLASEPILRGVGGAGR